MLHLRRWTSLFLLLNIIQLLYVCVFSARYFRRLYFGTFSVLGAAVRNPRQFAERPSLVLKGSPRDPRRGSTGPRAFWAGPARARAEQTAQCPGRSGRGCGQTRGRCLAQVRSPLRKVVRCDAEDHALREEHGRASSSVSSPSVGTGVSSACSISRHRRLHPRVAL